MDDERTEETLRRYLRGAVPPMPAPADRMAQVRRRVRLRRRRRGAAGLLAACSVLGVLALGGPDGLLSSADSPQTTPAAPPRGDGHVVLDPARPLTLAGLPRDWSALTTKDADGRTVAYAAPQPVFDRLWRDCTPARDDSGSSCPPDGKLLRAEVLVMFQYGAEPADRTTATAPVDSFSTAPATAPVCRAVTASHELTAWGYARPDARKEPFDVRVTSCLKAPYDETSITVKQMLLATFSHA